jgi:hypothetical protein
MKHLHSPAFYNAADLEPFALPIDALQPTGFVHALEQGLDSDRDPVVIRSRRLRPPVSGLMSR